MKKTALFFFFSLLFFSCEKEKTDRQFIIENAGIPLIIKVLIGGEVYMEYSYDDANLVIEEKSKFHYARHTYNDINQLINSDLFWDMSIVSSDSRVLEAAMNRKEWVSPDNTPISISHVFEYKISEHLAIKSFIRPSGNSNILEFLYENDRIIRATGYNNNSVSGFTDYLYDNNGNMIRMMKYYISSEGIAVLNSTTEYEYDNMHNPYRSFRRLLTPGIYTNQNNIIKETCTFNFDVGPLTEKVQVQENSYEYNVSGYPVKVNGLTEYVYR